MTDRTIETLRVATRLFAVPCRLSVHDADGLVLLELRNIHGESLNLVAKGPDYDAALDEMREKLTRAYHEGIRVVRRTTPQTSEQMVDALRRSLAIGELPSGRVK